MVKNARYILDRNEGASHTVDGHEIGDWPAVHGDTEAFAGLHFSEHPGNVVSQLTLRNGSHTQS